MQIGTATIFITAMSLVSKGLGIVRESVFAAKFGTTAEMDAFVMAFLLVESIGAYFITDLAAVYIPTYSRLVANENEQAGQSLNRSLLYLVGSIAMGISIFVGILADSVVSIVVPGFSQEAMEITARLIRIMMPTILFSGLLGYFMAIQEAQNQFRYSSTIHLVNNVVTIAIIWYFTSFMGIYAAALATGVSALAKIAVQLPGIKKCKVNYKLPVVLNQPSLRHMGGALIPVAFATTVVYLDLFITRYLASDLPAGSISILSYSAKIESVSVALLVTPLVTASFPRLATMAAMADKTEFARLFKQCFQMINFVILPIIAFLWFLRVPTVALLFQRGAFVAQDTFNTAQVVGFLLPAILFVSWQMLLVKALYSLQKTKVFALIILLFAAIDILLNCLWIGPYGLLGVAVARSVALCITVFLMIWTLSRWISGIEIGALLVSLCRLSLGAVVFGLLAKFGFDSFSGPDFIRLGFAFFIGSVGYLFTLRGLEAQEFFLFWELRKQIPLLSKYLP